MKNRPQVRGLRSHFVSFSAVSSSRHFMLDTGYVPILLPVLKIYSIRYVHYRFSVLAVISEHSHYIGKVFPNDWILASDVILRTCWLT